MKTGNTILLAEDDTSMRTLLGYILKRAGYEVDIVKNGREAIELIEYKMYDLVCSDVRMPEVNGLDLCRKVKSLEGEKKIPVILISASALPADRVVGHEAGCDLYIIKPFDVQEILEQIQDVLKAGIAN